MKRDHSFVVTVLAGEVSDSSIWNGLEPFSIGHPVRWMIENTEEGVLLHSSGDEPRALSKDELEGRVPLELTAGGKSKLVVALRPAAKLPPVYSTHGAETRYSGSEELRVYFGRGGWAADTLTIGNRFAGLAHGKKAFSLKRKGDVYRIESYLDGVRVHHVSSREAISLDRGEFVEWNRGEMRGAKIGYQGLRWRFDFVSASSIAKAVAETNEASVDTDPEVELLRRSAIQSCAAIAAFFALFMLWPKAEPQKSAEIPPQPTKIVLRPNHRALAPTQARAAAAPAGNRSEKRSQRKIVASHARSTSHAKPKAQAPRVAHASPKRAVKPPVVAHAAPKIHAVSKAHAAPKAKIVAQAKPRQAQPRVATRAQVSAKQPFSGLQRMAQGLANGGMTQLLAKSRFASGADSRQEAGALAVGGSTRGSRAGAGSSIGVRSVEVASLGGGSGVFGTQSPGYGKGSRAGVNGQGKSWVSLDTSGSDVDEGLTKDQVGAVIHRHMREVRYCYEAAQVRAPDVQGRLAVRFTINGIGGVQKASVQSSTLSDETLDDCVLRRLTTWKFPRPRGGVDVAVNYPFIFKTLGER